jgi:hypothetical protein
VRQQRGLGLDAEAHHFLGRHHGDLGQLLGRGVVVDVRVHQEDLAAGQHQAVHAGVGVHAGALADHLVDVVQVDVGGAPGAADHAVHVALVQQHGADQREAAAHLDLGHLRRHALALGHAVVGLPEVAVAVVLLDVDHVVVAPFLQAQAELLNALRDDGRAADQRGRAMRSSTTICAARSTRSSSPSAVGHALSRGLGAP